MKSNAHITLQPFCQYYHDNKNYELYDRFKRTFIPIWKRVNPYSKEQYYGKEQYQIVKIPKLPSFYR